MNIKTLSKVRKFCISTHSSIIITSEVIFGLIFCILSLVVFVWFSREILEKDTVFIDQSISLLVYSWRTPFLTQLMILITAFGNQILLILAASVTIIFAIKKHRKEAVLFCLAIAMGAVLNSTFKLMAQRPRPTLSPLIVEKSYSFPSGHAMNSFIFYALLAYFSYHFFRNKAMSIFVSIACGILIFLIGFSRIYLGVHYFTDVIAGYIAGFWWFITILLVEHTLLFYRLFKKSE